MVGPGKRQRSLDAPLIKYSQRAVEWSRAGLGLHMTLRAYRIYMMSVLLFVTQLEDPPEDFSAREQAACRRLFPGPTHWISPSFLQQLSMLGFPCSLPNLHDTATAAKSRVFRNENRMHGGLNIATRGPSAQELCGWLH